MKTNGHLEYSLLSENELEHIMCKANVVQLSQHGWRKGESSID